MLLEIKRVLKHDGILIMSTPDKKYYSDLTGYQNPFHVKELYFKDFERLILNYFKNAKFYVQKAYNLNSLVSNIDDFNNVVIYSGNQSKVSKSANQHLYILTIAAQHDINELPTSFFNGTDINKIILEHEIEINSTNIKNSKSYLFGNFFMKPLFKFRKKLNNFISVI